MNKIEKDRIRYGGERMPYFQCFYRKYEQSNALRIVYKCLFVLFIKRRLIDMAVDIQIGWCLLWPRILHNDKFESYYRLQL